MILTLLTFHNLSKLRTVKRNLSIQDIPLVCVTDKETASAAEVLVGCLKDQGRSYILGERTYGKGVAQGLYRLPDGR
jgi:C-terminal processing protease CtpA/Prc